MRYNHAGYLTYELPDGWKTDESDDGLSMYDPDGNGALTVSFFNRVDSNTHLNVQVSVLAKNFFECNNIKLNNSFILLNKDEKTVLFGIGKTADNWFIKLWVVAENPKIVLATYQSEQENPEVELCDAIVDSFKFEL